MSNPEPLAELCAKCGFTYYNHESNTGVPYPCWTPTGKYSVDKHTNAPRPSSPPPASTPHQHECISNSIDRCRERGYCECECGEHFWSTHYPATPSSPEIPAPDEIVFPNRDMTPEDISAIRVRPPETPAELTEALDEYERTSIGVGKAEGIPNLATSLDWVRGNAAAARSALISLYNRQREENLIWCTHTATGKRLPVTAKAAYEAAAEQVASLSSQLERLKADQLTAEDARYCLDNPPYHGFKHDLYAKLVRLRSSQSGGTTDV